VSVIVSHAQIQRVKDALALVKSNGQALAAVDAAQKAARDLRGHLSSEGGAIREGAAKSLDEYSRRLDPFRKQLNGAVNAAVGATWTKCKEQVFNLYMLAFTLESTMPPGADFGDGWGLALSRAVSDLPATIGKAVEVATKAATKVVAGVAQVGGSLVWGVVRGAWPLLLVVGIGAVVFFTVKGKLAKAVSL
jgi:hypothetical protein